MVFEEIMLYDRNCRQGPASETGARPKKEISNGLTWWRLKRDLSSASSAKTSVMSTSSPRERRQRPQAEEDSPSSANRLLFDGASSGDAAPPRQFETQEKPKTREDSNCHRLQWTRGSRDTEAPSPEEQEEGGDSSHDSARRRRPEEDLLGSSSGKLKSLKLATTSSAARCSSSVSSRGERTTGPDPSGTNASGTPVVGKEGDGNGSSGAPRGCRQEEMEGMPRHSEAHRRTPSKPPRPEQQQQQCYAAETRSRRGGNGSGANGEGTEAVAAARAEVGGGGSGSTDGIVPGTLRGEARTAADVDEGMDDETAVAMNTAKEPSVVYDILAVDRGCGYCDTSVVPFPVKDGGQVTADRMRAMTSGQGDFLARRGFAAGLVSHFLEETNCEFRVLQGGASCGMDAEQLEEAAIRLEEAFIPAVKRLRQAQKIDVILDSLFQGADDAGEFVVRFEVTITRCHPEDIESCSSAALRECAPAIREAVKEEGVAEDSTHEVVFVGRPMWELVSPVLDLSPKVGARA